MAILMLFMSKKFKGSIAIAMTLQNISRETSRVTKCLFHIVVFVFSILFDFKQSLDGSIKYIELKGKRKVLYIVFRARPI